jgi:hypothetical protein
MTDVLLLETGTDDLLLETGTDDLLLEDVPVGGGTIPVIYWHLRQQGIGITLLVFWYLWDVLKG